MTAKHLKPDYLFEVSWDVCDEAGGIPAALGTKAAKLKESPGEKYVFIFPDKFKGTCGNEKFIEDDFLFKPWRLKAQNDNINIRIGWWDIPGQPITILVDHVPLLSEKDNIFSHFWSKYGLDSLSGRWDYIEPAMFGYSAGQVIEHFYNYYLSADDRFIALFNDWTSGAGILYLNDKVPQAATVFNTQGTVLGKAISEQGINIEKEAQKIDPQNKAKELDVISKNSMELLAAKNADAFITINEKINNECKILFSKAADVITAGESGIAAKEPDSYESRDWKAVISNYYKAFDLAIKKANNRAELFKDKKRIAGAEELKTKSTQRLQWQKVSVYANIPPELKNLEKLSKNIWWSWNYEATELFESIDPELWEKCKKNPVRLLENLTTDQHQSLIKNDGFMRSLHRVMEAFNNYMIEGNKKSGKQIAYFSMEYGLHESIKLYSGGLGVLAGDYLKQASDDNVNLVGVGLLYRYGYFSQSLSGKGDQVSNYAPHHFAYMSAVPVKNKDGEYVKINIDLPGRTLVAKVWKIDIGRVPLYLLDTDLPENEAYDRIITHKLYGGDLENRLKQEILLGIGGIRLLDALELNPEIYHCNEGHAAFTGLERLRKYVQNEKLSYREALEVVRASGLFTTHTPVPAGHDFFSEDMLRNYMQPYAEDLSITWEALLNLGKMKPANPDEDFSMSVLAANVSQEVNGVSKIHGKVSREMFDDLYPGYFPEELHIGHVTNGVHYLTWTAKQWQKLYRQHFGKDFLKDCSNPKRWEKIYNVPDETIWQTRNSQKKLLIEYVKNRLLSSLPESQEALKSIYQTIDVLRDDVLTIGFARRFATYKRATLLFNDPEILSRIVNMKDMPVLFIFAGKAHPADKAGQDFIKKIVEYSNKEEFRGKILFLEDYDMELARYLVQGVDIWLNTPTRPMEASGTSGQKAALNGVLNFSVLDGWWAEGYTTEAGWCLKEESTYENQEMQNKLDASIIYNLLENEIIPMFYDRNSNQIPEKWVSQVKNNIAKVAPHFTNKRMLDDYIKHFYQRNFDYTEKIKNDNYARAKELAAWKKSITDSWDKIEVKSRKVLNTPSNAILQGENFVAEITVDIKDMSSNDIGMEVIFFQKSFEEQNGVSFTYDMEQIKKDKNLVTFRVDMLVKKPGVYNYAFRMFPKHKYLANRQSLNLTKWL